MLAFLTGPLGRYLLAAVAVLGLLGAVFGKGYHAGAEHEKAGEAKREARAVAAAHKREAAAQQIADQARAELNAAQARVEVRTRTLIQRVPYAVTAKDDAACRVPDGLVRLHDAAATGSDSVPEAASGSGPTAPVPLSALTSTVIGNYGTALGWRAEAEAWRGWYVKQRDAWDGAAPAKPKRRFGVF